MNRWLPALLIVVLLAGFRILGSAFPENLPNFQPLPAILLCSLVFLNGIQRWLVPALAWLITDPVTSLLQGYPVLGWHNLSVALGIAATVGISQIARRNTSTAPVLFSAALSAIAFYFLTNFVSFATDPLYAKDLHGFAQAQWTGPTGFGPTWLFLRNLMAANLAFTAIFLAARNSLPQPVVKPSGALAR